MEEKLILCFHRFFFVMCFVIPAGVCMGQTIAPDHTDKEEQVMDQLLTDPENLQDLTGEIQEFFIRKKIDPNRADVARMLEVFTLAEIELIRKHIARYGPLASVWELQAVRGLTKERIQQAWPYLQTGEPMAEEEKIEVLYAAGIRNTAIWDPDETFRLRGQTRSGVRYHFTADQDAGEPFRFTADQAGFDHISAGVSMVLGRSGITRLLLGDHRLFFGQGLIIGQGFGIRKSADLNLLVKGRDQVQLHRSSAQSGFQRGICLHHPGNRTGFTISFGTRYENASVHQTDQGRAYFRTFNASPVTANSKHRNTVHLTELAWHIRHSPGTMNIGLTGYMRHTDLPQWSEGQDGSFIPLPGYRYSRYGADWNGAIGTFYLFGEMGISSVGSGSIVAGMLKSLNPGLDMSIVYRNYRKDPVTYNRGSIKAGSAASNESGLLFVFDHRPGNGIHIKWLTDLHEKPVAQGSSPGPVHRVGHTLRIQKKWDRHSTGYLQVNRDHKTAMVNDREDRLPVMRQTRFTGYRLHFEHFPLSSVRLRWRLMGMVNESNRNQWSILGYSDIRYRKAGKPWDLIFRWSMFMVPAFDLRLYAYENDVLYNHRIPAYGKNGARLYMIWSVKASRGVQVQLKGGITVSGGQGEDNGAAVPDLRIQLRWHK